MSTKIVLVPKHNYGVNASKLFLVLVTGSYCLFKYKVIEYLLNTSNKLLVTLHDTEDKGFIMIVALIVVVLIRMAPWAHRFECLVTRE